MANNKANEIGELQSILYSRTFYAILNEHKEYLQKDVNKFVRAQDLINAYATLCKLDDIDKVVMLMQNRLVELKKQ